MEKAIEIKRRAQRCILNGDLNGALAEYEKLVAIGDPDPYYCVLLADLLYKMGSAQEAQKRYLEAVQGYAKSGLYKNGIAVCKKMTRLTLAPIEVPRALAQLYSLDGLSTEAGLAYQQLAEVLVKHDRVDEARTAFKQAIEVTPDSGRLYERLGELEVLAGDNEAAGNAWSDAAERFERAGLQEDLKRCRSRIAQLRLPMPPRGSASAAPEAMAPREVSSAPVLSWEEPESNDVAAGPLSISHTPPIPDELDEEADEQEQSSPVSVVHGFGRLEASLPTSDEADDEVDDEAGDAADEEMDDEPSVEEREVEEPEIEEAPVAPRTKGGPVPAKRGTPAPAQPAEPAEPALSLAGFDPNDYSLDEAPETNGPVAPPVEDAESKKRGAIPPKRAIEPPAPARREEVAAPRGAAPAAAVSAGPPVMRSPAAAPPRPVPATPVTSAAPPVAKPPAARPPEPRPAEAPDSGANRFGDEVTPAQPGLVVQSAGEPAAESEDAGLAQVSLILAEAQACFHAGDRDAATIALIRAAQAYDQIGRHDSAVAIYRSLGQSPDVSLQLMMLWLKNCQRRNDREEAARVACELGDRALNDGDVPGAQEWFERARVYDPNNELAARRLKSLDPNAQAPAEAAAESDAPAPTSVSAVAGHLNVRAERDEPVIVDLGTLIEEFQRAIEPELASDPQGHYDLGMSYREMGLTEQAVQSLRIAAKAPAFRLRAGELAGRCLLDLGHFDEAAEMLRGTLEAPDLLPSAAVDLRYQLALALEAAGRSAEALSEFERVYAAQANYPDVAMKIRLLRKTAGAA